MSSSLNKIHVSNSTGLSLNERFTAITSQPKVKMTNVNGRQNRSRSRSVQRTISANVDRTTSRANHRLLAQLQRKHKMQTALKLKRRSMRTVGGGSTNRNAGPNGRIQRGSVKAFRVGANGKPIKANSLTNIATMKADREILNKQRRPLRRSNSSGSIANRLGPRRPAVGGAAQRVAKRNLDRQHGIVPGSRRNSGAAGGRLLVRDGINGRSAELTNRGRSRSRSRTRSQPLNSGRNRSRSRNPEHQQSVNIRGRSRSRNRNDANARGNNNRRGRSLSRNRGGVLNKSALPIKARLGVRPGENNVRTPGNNRRPNNNRRNASLIRRGVQSGRVQKRRNSANQNVVRLAPGGDNNQRNRVRSRSVVRNATIGGVQSRSRTRKGQVGQQRQQLGSGQARQQQQRNNRAPRGRSQQRRGGNSNGRNVGGPNNGNAQTQQRRGRSRSRTGRGANGGQRNPGNKPTTVNKDDLDKELDQYMATTKTENDMDYLLKN